ncbi:MAG TPA: hypothetical protein PLB27_05980 [Bacteroidales bacterium]|nr:hypothetical protein [Bacteroidales bacterium]
MRKTINRALSLVLFAFIFLISNVSAQQLSDYSYNGKLDVLNNAVMNETQFNGYTNHWWNDYEKWYRYGNFYKISIPDVEKKIVQSKIDIAEDMKVPGLWMQEGFIMNWLSGQCSTLENPSASELTSAAAKGNVLVITSPATETGRMLLGKYSRNASWKTSLKSYQFNDPFLKTIDAFMLENGAKKIFVISSADNASALRIKDLLENVKKVITTYDMHKGWFGTETLLKSVTCTPGHPLEIIGKGMNEGNSWFVFSGYMDFLMKDELAGWLARTQLPVVADVGYSPIYGLDNYNGLQVQDMQTKESWINYAHSKNGYVFRPVYDVSSDQYKYDGYIASAGNKLQIDTEGVPFIVRTGNLLDNLIPSMIVFIKKGEKLTQKLLFDAIMDSREVGVLDDGVIMGPEEYRTAMQMLLLDRLYLENYYGDRIDLQAEVKDYTLNLTITNTYDKPVSGNCDIQLPKGVITDGILSSSVTIPAKTSQTVQLKIRPDAEGMDYPNPIAAGFKWGDNRKYTMCVMEMPPAISVHRIIYGHTPVVSFPVSIHNFTNEVKYPVTVRVLDKNKPGKPVFTATQFGTNPTGTFTDLKFDLKVPAGNFDVEVTALGVKSITQMGVGKASGKVLAYAMDLNSDGVNEFRLENDSVQVTLLATGARVIEYIVKSRNDNVLFKLWPEKSGDDKRPNRSWGYYPYGGFEDFLGQASMETHKVYDAELIKKDGDYVQVKMSADYYGNKLEKTFTLYGNSPLLEVRYALRFINPEANVIGPQPILEMGKTHWTEDVFTVPTIGGNQEFRMRPEQYYGRALMIEEGWNAGYDEKEDVSFIGAFPVSQPHFLHMWMNHPINNDAHHYYVEFQPWTPICQKTTMYFTYYLWGSGGPWESALKEMRNRNLISVRQK